MAGFDWEQFIVLAEELVERRADVGAERTAISRAYYAAFHGASAYVCARGQRLTRTGVDHALVWDWFFGAGADRRLQWIGTQGIRLRRARRRADYEPAPIPNCSIEAQNAVRLARRILRELSAR